MKWAKTTKYQTSISIEGEVFNILCESDFDEDFALSINGDYVCDVNTLPTYEELVEYADNYITLEEATSESFRRNLL